MNFKRWIDRIVHRIKMNKINKETKQSFKHSSKVLASLKNL